MSKSFKKVGGWIGVTKKRKKLEKNIVDNTFKNIYNSTVKNIFIML